MRGFGPQGVSEARFWQQPGQVLHQVPLLLDLLRGSDRRPVTKAPPPEPSASLPARRPPGGPAQHKPRPQARLPERGHAPKAPFRSEKAHQGPAFVRSETTPPTASRPRPRPHSPLDPGLQVQGHVPASTFHPRPRPHFSERLSPLSLTHTSCFRSPWTALALAWDWETHTVRTRLWREGDPRSVTPHPSSPPPGSSLPGSADPASSPLSLLPPE